MLFNSRTVALVVAGAVAFITTAFLSMVDQTPLTALLVAGGLSFGATFILVYVTLEWLIFRQINRIYEALDEIKRKDFKSGRKRVRTSSNPFKQLNDDIFAVASKKQQEINELRQLENFRRDFLADVSHELKTPIFAAQGFIHTLIDGAVDDAPVRDKFLLKAAQSLDGLNLIVQDLITLSKMETGVIKMNFSHFDLYQLVIEVFEQLEEKAEIKGIDLRLHKKSDTSAVVYADRDRIRQVLTNLTENGVKHGHRGGKIRVNMVPDPAGVVVSVKDNGPGIGEEHINRIFERFYRVEKSRSKNKGGSGLGLAIVKHILEAHGTVVEVSSQIDKGTTFKFRLAPGNPQEEVSVPLERSFDVDTPADPPAKA